MNDKNTISAVELRNLLSAGSDIHVIDVRTGSEFESAHIPGSYHVPLDTLGEHRDELRRHVTQPVVLVCQSGNRATQAAAKLAEAGMTNVKVLEGGIGSWGMAGGELRHGKQRWGLDRQVRLVAGSLVVAGALTSLAVPGAQLVAAFVGGGLVFSAVTNTCGMAAVLSRLPYNRTASCDVREVVAQLVAANNSDNDLTTVKSA